ncbi:MAG: hypothetical protein Q9161_001256 [Pseudevernia consocians]
MANLSTAPPEIISMILPLVLPEDLENFAQCCKAVHQQADRKKGNNGHSLLQEHRILIKKYSVLTDLDDVGPFLKAMTADQRIARYVLKINFGRSLRVEMYKWGTDRIWEDRNISEDWKVYDLLMSAAKTIRMNYHFLRYIGKGYRYQNHIKRTIGSVCVNTELAIALLLPLLPNISALSLQWHWTDSPYDWTKHWITNLANSSTPILKKLKEVNVHLLGQGCALPEIVCLTALPSLQRLAIWKLESPFPSVPQIPSQRQSYTHNTVSNLKLWNTGMDTWLLYDYLESFDNLKSFSFLGQTLVTEIFDPMPLFAILLSHSKSTLTKLSLRSCNGNATAKPPFKQLEVLKELYVDWQMLLPQPYVVGENWEAILPQSMEALTIHDHYHLDKFEDWNAQLITTRLDPVVEDLISCKTGGLPGISDFSFTAGHGLLYRPEYWMPLVGLSEMELGFRNRCELAGLRFSFKEAEE